MTFDIAFLPKGRCSSLAYLLALSTVLLSGCERSYWDPTVKISNSEGHLVDTTQTSTASARRALTEKRRRAGGSSTPTPLDTAAAGTGAQAEILQRGTGSFVRKVSRPSVATTPGDVTLNFDGTDIREVVKVVLGDLLGANYVLDPSVQGVVSLQTGRPLRREDLVPTLETLLRMNNAAILYRAGTYEVVPLNSAMQGKVVPQLGESSRPLPVGYSVQVVPLRYIGAEEMSSILQPLAPEGSVIRIDALRNLLVIAGTSPEMSNLLDTIQIFDVDWMAGLSVGFFVLEYANAGDVKEQLSTLLADEAGSPLKGLFRFVPIESANALLVVSPQESYIQQARNWIERLDMAEATGSAAERLFVYRVKHGDAGNLADILSQLFDHSGDGSSSVGSIAPGYGQASMSSGPISNAMQATLLDEQAMAGGTNATGGLGQASSRANTSREFQISSTSSVSIVADAVNNSLLIRSSPRDYKKILDALKQLDIVPLQVQVEATIVEITLTGNLQYGVQWELFGPASKGKNFASFDGTLDSSKTSGISTSFPGFNWAIVSNPNTIKATLSALAGDNLVNVLSSPSVMVMDNQTAKIQVGKQVPVATSQQQSTSTVDRVINTIEYKDTGVLLTVKPRVTPGGLVQMDIEQEVSTVASTDSSKLDSPTFQTRKINSNVAVRSNQAVVLGGLIQDQREDGRQGVPGLYNLPFAGALFGERRKSANRTELMVVLTPRVISSDQDIESVTNDFRNKLRNLNFKF